MEKKIFTLGGFQFEAPAIVGAGVRARYNENQMKAILSSGFSKDVIKMIAELSIMTDGKRFIPEHLREDVMTEQVFDERYGAVLKSFLVSNIYSYRLILLETVLTPCAGSPSVKDAYDVAEEREVSAIENFFAGKSQPKTDESNGTPNDSPEKSKQTEAVEH